MLKIELLSNLIFWNIESRSKLNRKNHADLDPDTLEMDAWLDVSDMYIEDRRRALFGVNHSNDTLSFASS